VTRGELAESLAAVFGKVGAEALRTAAADSSELDLSDVPPDHRYREAVAVTAQLGLLRVSAAGTFRPLAFASGAEAVRAVRTLRDLLGRS